MSLRWPGIVEDDPDYKCCYETDDSDVNPVGPTDAQSSETISLLSKLVFFFVDVFR